MLYLLDANVLIDANRDYYALERVPQFWEWLLNMAVANSVKVPRENYFEVINYSDDLADWAKDNQDSLVLAEAGDRDRVDHVVSTYYAPDLNESELNLIGKDPFLVFYALNDRQNRTVVTTEVSRPSRLRANRQLPDVCNDASVRCINTFEFIKELDFHA